MRTTEIDLAKVQIFQNKNAFQYDAYLPLQWPPLDVSTGSLPRGGGGLPRGKSVNPLPPPGSQND